MPGIYDELETTGGNEMQGGRWLLCLLILVIIIYCCWSCFAKMMPVKYRLETAGWQLFFDPNCPYSQKQLEVLGGSYKYLKICPGNYNCQYVSGFPTWYNPKSGKYHSGFLSNSGLKDLLV